MAGGGHAMGAWLQASGDGGPYLADTKEFLDLFKGDARNGGTGQLISWAQWSYADKNEVCESRAGWERAIGEDGYRGHGLGNRLVLWCRCRLLCNLGCAARRTGTV